MRKIILIANNARSMLLFRLCFIKKLLNLGFEVIVCAPYDQADFESLEKLGVRTESFQMSRKGINPFKEISSLLQIRKILMQHKPHTCMFYTIKPVIYGSLACLGLGVDKVCSMITGLGYVFTGETFTQRILRFFIKIAYIIVLRINYKVFFLNRDDLSYFVTNRIVSGSQGCLINGEGVDLESHAFFVSPEKPIVFLFVGRLLKDKGLYEYVAAARVIKNKYPMVIFRIVGGMDDNPACINNSELQFWINEGIIDYCGYLADIRVALRKSSIFVLPSYREGMPVSILEAMATGRPIITTNAPGCWETTNDGVNGFLAPIKNVEALVAAMEKFVLTPELIVEMGQKSRIIAEEKFDANKISESIIINMGLLK